MEFRFSEIPILDNGEADYDDTTYIGTIRHDDYTEYTKLLYLMKENDIPFRPCGNLSLVKEDGNGNGQLNSDHDKESTYSIIDIILRVPLDKINLECVEVYVCPSW